MKEIFGLQKLKLSLSETFLEKKLPLVLLVLLFYLRYTKEVICKNETHVL